MFTDAEAFFNNIRDFNYLIIRNFEQFPDALVSDNHGDIDILCLNKNDLISAIGAKGNSVYRDNYHFLVDIGGRSVELDIREVGDGYFCDLWSEEMLAGKVLTKNLFYTMNSNDYFYSLAYHCAIQKGIISEQYYELLKDIGNT